MIMMRYDFICIIAGLFAIATSAEAVSPPARTTIGAPAQRFCADDLARLCKAVPAGAGRKFACLDAHSAQLRPPCRAFIDALYASYVRMATQRHETVAKFLADAYARYNTGVKVRPGNQVPTPPKPTPPR